MRHDNEERIRDQIKVLSHILILARVRHLVSGRVWDQVTHSAWLQANNQFSNRAGTRVCGQPSAVGLEVFTWAKEEIDAGR
jgi:hypothetical protein